MKEISVKVMLSYDYCHFEVSLTEEGLDMQGVNELRKKAQRLADEAVRQYKIAKTNAQRRVDVEGRVMSFESECLRIRKKEECDRTLKEIAMLKQYEDEKWREQFEDYYDYDDSDEPEWP